MNSNDLLDIVGEAKEEHVLDAVNTRNGVQPKTKRLSLSRGFLIAAIIVSLSATAYAAVIRLLNWTPEMEEYLAPYNEETSPGAVARDWYIEDVDILLSIDQPETSVLPISAETWTDVAEGTLEVGTEYWIEKWNGTAYQEIHTLDGKPWIVPAQTLDCNGEFSWTADYAQSYGKLEPGHYRLGMMISLIPPTGERTEMGCYAKFQIYTKDIKPYMPASRFLGSWLWMY